jgi:hypothetical protein
MSLSLYFCPTAAGLLLDGGPLEVVGDAPADARGRLSIRRGDALPPLLRPGLLDWILTCGSAPRSNTGRDDPPRRVLAIIDVATEQIRPCGSPL